MAGLVVHQACILDQSLHFFALPAFHVGGPTSSLSLQRQVCAVYNSPYLIIYVYTDKTWLQAVLHSSVVPANKEAYSYLRLSLLFVITIRPT